jgi:hypothetical protein
MALARLIYDECIVSKTAIVRAIRVGDWVLMWLFAVLCLCGDVRRVPFLDLSS